MAGPSRPRPAATGWLARCPRGRVRCETRREGEAHTIVSCPNCQAENADGRRFCDQCGTSLAPACPNCGGQNRPGARFCGDCGTPLDPGTAAASRSAPTPTDDGTSVDDVATVAAGTAGAERRLVSVLFADLVAFTEYSEGRDPELVRETLTRYFEATREVIERHGGHVEKFIGDAVMAAWGAPKANEDDAERAVRAALEVTDAVRTLEEGLEARVAVLTGQAAVTIGATDQGMVAGDLVNTAARLQAAAPPNTVLVGEATMQAASSGIAFEEAGAQVLRGKEAPVPAWRALRIVGELGGRSRAEGLEPPFVGREVELRLLKDLLHQTGEEQRPRLISITGPAGIGKSRLAWEFEKYADGLVEDIWWHRGRAPSYGEGVTFWALGEMVRKRAGLAESDDEATTRVRLHEAVIEYVPEEDDREWIEPALLTLLGVEPAPAGGREVLFAAWRTFFERIALKGTTIMLFEDLQWADGGQLDFIDHLMEWARGVPLFVVTLARPELLERRPGWGTAARSFTTIGLEPLTDEQMRALTRGLVPAMPDDAIASILARADGIPLYAVETVRMLIADGRLRAEGDGTYAPAGDLGELAVPDTLRALVASRLDSLPDEDRALLQDAAVLGKTFTPEALAAISGDDGDGLEPRLRSLAQRELLEITVDPRSPERGQYGFVQSVIREVAYETLSRRDRRSRHLAAARYFEGLGDDELAGVLSTHYLAAYEASDEGPEADALQVQARLALRGAADRATELGAMGQALVCIRQALDITEASRDRGELLERGAAAADQGGLYDEAEELCREAIAAFESSGDRSGVARASVLMGQVLNDASKIVEAAEFLQAAIAAADREEDVVYRADMLARLSRAQMRLGEHDKAVGSADEALTIAEPRRLVGIMAEAIANKGTSLSGMRRRREALALLEAAVPMAVEAGDMTLALRARNNLAAILSADDSAAAMAHQREAYELASKLGIRQMALWLAGAMAYYAVFEGKDWDAALRLLAHESEGPMADADRGRLLATRMNIEAWRGEDITAAHAEREQYVDAVSDADAAAWSVMLPAIRMLTTGAAAEAVGEFRRAIPMAIQNGTDARLGFIRSALWARDLEAAREALTAAQSDSWFGFFVDAERELASAGVAALEGHREEALAGFRRSIELFDRVGVRFDRSMVQLTALMLLPDEPSIADWSGPVRDCFEDVKSPALLERLDEALAARVTT